MLRVNVTKRMFLVSFLSLAGLALAFAIVTFVLGPRAAAETLDWPPFSMTYEVDGTGVAVGPNPGQVLREVHLMEYQSKTEWKDTVINAKPINTRVGTFSRVGSYQQLSGRTFTEFDSIVNSTAVETIDEGVTLIATGFRARFPLEMAKKSGIKFTRVDTNAKVCFREQCTENAQGLLYRKPSGSEVVFVDDARGIPLRVNDSFVVKEIQINDDRLPLEP